MNPHHGLVALPFAILLAGCAAPRAVLWDGTTGGRGDVQGHLGMVGCLPTATLEAVGQSAVDALEPLVKEQSFSDEKLYGNGTRTLVAAGLDMPGANVVAEIHVGLGWGLEAGYRREGGANAWALRWQFLSAADAGWNAGVGAMYSSLDYDLPSTIGDFQKLLGYEFKRTDIEVPLVFSKPFGDGGKYGSAGFGLVGAWTRTRYGFDPDGIYRRWGGEVELLERLPEQEMSFFSYGGMGYLKVGYKHVWLFGGLTVMTQDYGSYKVPSREDVKLSGTTILPSLGVEFRI